MISVPADWQILPGVRIGGLEIGLEQSRTVALLGKPTGGEGAMGHFWSTWIGKSGGRIDAYAARKFPAGADEDVVTVDLVRVTSARFRLPNGLRTGLSSLRFRTLYHASAAGSYRTSTGRVNFWDDVRNGLAWETSGDRVVAVIVHRKGKPLDRSIGPYLTNPVRRS